MGHVDEALFWKAIQAVGVKDIVRLLFAYKIKKLQISDVLKLIKSN